MHLIFQMVHARQPQKKHANFPSYTMELHTPSVPQWDLLFLVAVLIFGVLRPLRQMECIVLGIIVEVVIVYQLLLLQLVSTT